MSKWNQPVRRSAAPTLPGAAVPWMFVLLLAAWLIDFPSEGQGKGLDTQAYFLGIYILALTVMLIGHRDTGRRITGLPTAMVCGVFYLGVAISGGLIANQSVYMILRNALTVAIYLSSMFVTARVVLNSDPGKIRRLLGLFCLLYAVSNFIMFYLAKGGIDFEYVRYQIIGVSVIAALAYLTLLLMFRLNTFEFLAMAANTAIVLASITRTYLLVAVIQLLSLAGLARRVLSPRVLVFGLMGVLAAGAVLVYGELQLARWQDRLFGAGSRHTESWTVDTRLSEWTFMAREWTDSLTHFLFGNGLAAQTLFFLPSQLGYGTGSMIGFGHNQHLSMVFTAGLIGGLPLLIVQARQGIDGLRFVRATARNPHLRNDAVFLGAWGGLIVIGYLIANMFDSIFSYRGDSMWYGIGTGLLLGARALFDPANAPQAGRAIPPSARYCQPA